MMFLTDTTYPSDLLYLRQGHGFAGSVVFTRSLTFLCLCVCAGLLSKLCSDLSDIFRVSVVEHVFHFIVIFLENG